MNLYKKIYSKISSKRIISKKNLIQVFSRLKAKVKLIRGWFMKKLNSIQQWMPYEKIMQKGIIKLKNNEYIKILKIIPINYNLKSNLEKEAILNSYKTFLRTCNFDIQIIVQSNKEDLTKNILKIKNQMKSETEKIKNIAENYINYIQQIGQEKKSSSKNFFILIKNSIEKNNNNYEENSIQELNEKYFKIKDSLSRCGNIIIQFENEKEIKKILYSFFYPDI